MSHPWKRDKIATEFTRKLYQEHLHEVADTLQKARSENRPELNINEVAKNELHYLKKCFPDFLKEANINKLEASLTPAEVIKALEGAKNEPPQRT